jgi:hypothetical protein
MKTGDRVRVYPHGKPRLSAVGKVAMCSTNGCALVLLFEDKPPFVSASPGFFVHAELGCIVMLLSRYEVGPWIEATHGGHYEIEEPPTYMAGWDDAGDWIECRMCGMKSYNPNDVRQRYCGKCHVFHGQDPLGASPGPSA